MAEPGLRSEYFVSRPIGRCAREQVFGDLFIVGVAAALFHCVVEQPGTLGFYVARRDRCIRGDVSRSGLSYYARVCAASDDALSRAACTGLSSPVLRPSFWTGR